jgi:hypothetical protein
MKKLEIKKQFTVDTKAEEWYQTFGKEATKWFKQNCHWIPWKYQRISIERAWHIAQKENDHTISHFISNINKS